MTGATSAIQKRAATGAVNASARLARPEQEPAFPKSRRSAAGIRPVLRRYA